MYSRDKFNKIKDSTSRGYTMKNKFQTLREEKFLTQTELAEKSGLSLRTVQRVEAGNYPKGFTLKTLAAALAVDPESLLQEGSTNEDASYAKIINLSCLLFLIIPFGNIIAPALLIRRTGEKTKLIGKNILSIQIIWVVIICISMIVCPFVQYALSIKFPLFIMVFAILICVNVFIIIRNGVSLTQTYDLHIKLKHSIL